MRKDQLTTTIKSPFHPTFSGQNCASSLKHPYWVSLAHPWTLFSDKIWPERAAATSGLPQASGSLIPIWVLFCRHCTCLLSPEPQRSSKRRQLLPSATPRTLLAVLTSHTAFPVSIAGLRSCTCFFPDHLSAHLPLDVISLKPQAGENQTQSSKPWNKVMSSEFLGTLMALRVCLVAGDETCKEEP